jgi:hypothetical protein
MESHDDTFPSLRGNPSIKNFVRRRPDDDVEAARRSRMAFRINRTVISPGTICPAFIFALMISAYSESSFVRSARNRSPADK